MGYILSEGKLADDPVQDVPRLDGTCFQAVGDSADGLDGFWSLQ